MSLWPALAMERKVFFAEGESSKIFFPWACGMTLSCSPWMTRSGVETLGISLRLGKMSPGKIGMRVAERKALRKGEMRMTPPCFSLAASQQVGPVPTD